MLKLYVILKLHKLVMESALIEGGELSMLTLLDFLAHVLVLGSLRARKARGAGGISDQRELVERRPIGNFCSILSCPSCKTLVMTV